MTSCILVLIKNEHEYLKEFIEYHLNIGINHIIVIEDIDSKSHESITNEYDNVTLLNALDLYETQEEKEHILYKKSRYFVMQQSYLKNGLKYVKNHYNYDWCFIIDIDEYITIENDNVNNILELYKDYDAIVLQWKNFGNNNLIYKPDYTKKGIIETYTKECKFQRGDDTCWYQKVKTVYNMNNFNDDLFGGDHLPKPKSNWCRTNYTQDTKNLIYDKIYLKHYITKSWEEYIYKITIRGMFYKNHRKYDSFFEMNPDMLDKKEELMEMIPEIINKYNK